MSAYIIPASRDTIIKKLRQCGDPQRLTWNRFELVVDECQPQNVVTIVSSRERFDLEILDKEEQ